MKKAEAIAYPVSGIILFISKIFAPAIWLLTKTTNGILRIFRINTEAVSHSVTEEEIRLMIDLGSAKGTIEDGDKEIINNVFEFGYKNAGEVMTHRRDTVFLKLEDTDLEWETAIIENKHSNFPVCGKNPDDITGVLKARDYLCLGDRSRANVIENAIKPAQFVPNTVKTDRLFRRMKKNHNHFAVVLDEYGGMMGVVTMTDLLEELVGNLDDDNTISPMELLIEKTGPDTWVLNGAVSLDKAAREFGVALPVERYDTFAGFVFSHLGRIPEDGNHAELTEHGLKIKILEVKERRLEKAQVTLLPDPLAKQPEETTSK
jgi:putative hemolysin